MNVALYTVTYPVRDSSMFNNCQVSVPIGAELRRTVLLHGQSTLVAGTKGNNISFPVFVFHYTYDYSASRELTTDTLITETRKYAFVFPTQSTELPDNSQFRILVLDTSGQPGELAMPIAIYEVI